MSLPHTRPLDTSREAHEIQTEIYRRMGGTGRTAVMFRLTTMARNNAAAGIRRRHPDYDEASVRRALCRLVLGDDLVREVWPDLPLVDP